ncbi:unnamed protein product [Soboliphyme baturini]|uniref:Secreted protein n=1 Tax=Soboliphyme baturini TaxID=241478 RepID=A0A183J7B1_9BILA|nr:unnamed protein product [Soboliphyme baturini]
MTAVEPVVVVLVLVARAINDSRLLTARKETPSSPAQNVPFLRPRTVLTRQNEVFIFSASSPKKELHVAVRFISLTQQSDSSERRGIHRKSGPPFDFDRGQFLPHQPPFADERPTDLSHRLGRAELLNLVPRLCSVEDLCT